MREGPSGFAFTLYLSHDHDICIEREVSMYIDPQGRNQVTYNLLPDKKNHSLFYLRAPNTNTLLCKIFSQIK